MGSCFVLHCNNLSQEHILPIFEIFPDKNSQTVMSLKLMNNNKNMILSFLLIEVSFVYFPVFFLRFILGSLYCNAALFFIAIKK